MEAPPPETRTILFSVAICNLHSPISLPPTASGDLRRWRALILSFDLKLASQRLPPSVTSKRVKSPPQALPEAHAGGEENFAVSSGFKLDINGFYVYLCYIRPHTTSVHVDCARTLSHACAEFIARCRRTLFVPSGETVSHCTWTCSPGGRGRECATHQVRGCCESAKWGQRNVQCGMCNVQ